MAITNRWGIRAKVADGEQGAGRPRPPFLRREKTGAQSKRDRLTFSSDEARAIAL
jgi:hypothetical protein